MKSNIMAGILLGTAFLLIFLTPFFPLDEIIIGLIGVALGIKGFLK